MFGKSYLLDMYACREGACDDMELHYRFLEELVEKLGMHKMCPPYVLHAPSIFSKINNKLNRIEEYPDKAGISCWVGLIESGIAQHSLEPSHFSSIDVYTCGKLDIDMVREFAKETFGFQDYEEVLINRGTKWFAG